MTRSLLLATISELASQGQERTGVHADSPHFQAQLQNALDCSTCGSSENPPQTAFDMGF